MKRTTNPLLRREQILNTALMVADKVGYKNVSRGMIAKEIGCSKPLISQYFTQAELQKAIIKTAITREIISIVAQGIAARDPATRWIKADLKKKALDFLAR